MRYPRNVCACQLAGQVRVKHSKEKYPCQEKILTAPGVQVIAPDGKYLGLIPTPRPVISVAFSGPDKKTPYVLAQGAKDAQGKEVDNAAQVYSIPMIAQGFKERAK